ncbi:hypothetical protein D3C76_1490770 [compost metagenome]
MILSLSPIVMHEALVVEVQGDILILNGEPLDFSPLEPGAVLPDGAVDNRWVAGPVLRGGDNELRITLLLPIGGDASYEARFPEPIHVTEDGPVELPR